MEGKVVDGIIRICILFCNVNKEFVNTIWADYKLYAGLAVSDFEDALLAA